MNPDIAALRAAMVAAQPSGRGNYIEDGKHKLVCKLGKCKRTLISGKWKESYILEFEVLESSNPTHTVGSSRAYIENPENAGWDGRMKSCVLALLGVDPSSKYTPAMDEAFADIVAAMCYDEYRVAKGLPENFLAGRTVECEGAKGTSRAGGPVTNKKWFPWSPNIAAQS